MRRRKTLFISILLVKVTLTYYRSENCELRSVRMRKSAWKNVVKTQTRCVMTFHRRNEIKPNDGSQSLTRNLCSTVATKLADYADGNRDSFRIISKARWRLCCVRIWIYVLVLYIR